jgi:hypothetical protein
VADLPGRQQTLTSTIQWSYDLLPAPDQQMLARLSVFAAPFTAAAEAVGSQEDRDAVQDLATLLDNSMVSPADRPDGERAFRLLGPIRRFAAAQLADPGPTLGRLERYLLGVLDDASPHYGSQDQDMHRLGSEQPNLRAVLAWIADGRRPPDQLVRALGDVWVWLLSPRSPAAVRHAVAADRLAAAVRDHFGLRPWPCVTQAERRTIQQTTALLSDGEYAAQLAAGRARPSRTHSLQLCRSKTRRRILIGILKILECPALRDAATGAG